MYFNTKDDSIESFVERISPSPTSPEGVTRIRLPQESGVQRYLAKPRVFRNKGSGRKSGLV